MTPDPDPNCGVNARLVELRRDLHRHPELGFEEHRTSGVVRRFLEQLGLEPCSCVDTGVVVDLVGGAGDGPTIALRADLDALPIDERTELPYRSAHAGVSHKCGHDGHTAILCGVAEALMPRLGGIGGRVRLIFQPDEEGHRGGGARRMVEAGVLDGVDEIYGLHNWPGFPLGEVRVCAGVAMASVEDFEVELTGVGGHASQPQVACDPVLAGAQVVSALSSLTLRERGLDGGAVVQVTQFHAGEADNVIPETAILRGTIRCLDPLAAGRLRGRIAETVTAVTGAFGVGSVVRTLRGYPVLVNDPDCARYVAESAQSQFGTERVSSAGLPIAAAEDFAYFTEACAGAYFFLGAGDPVGSTPGCHHPDFDFDDRLLQTGVDLFTALVEARLGRSPG